MQRNRKRQYYPRSCFRLGFHGRRKCYSPHVVLNDRKNDAYWSTVLDSKTSSYATAFCVGALKETGYKIILFKSDNEPAILKLKDRIAESLPGVEVVPREVPVGTHEANGAAENAVKIVKGQYRSLKTSTEDRYGCKNKRQELSTSLVAQTLCLAPYSIQEVR